MIQETVESLTQLLTQLVLTAHYPAARANLWTMVTKSVSGALATGAQASSLAITRRRDNTATGTVALQSYPVATLPVLTPSRPWTVSRKIKTPSPHGPPLPLRSNRLESARRFDCVLEILAAWTRWTEWAGGNDSCRLAFHHARAAVSADTVRGCGRH